MNERVIENGGDEHGPPNDIENPKSALVKLMTSEYERLSSLSSECCIYTVSERLRQVRENAYTPQVVSIGPLHHGNKSLKAMEEHKIRFLWAYIQRTGESLEFYVDIVKGWEEKLRSCYAESLHCTSDELVKIVLVDAAFIIEVLLRNNFEEFQDMHDRIFKKPWMLQDILPDLRLLENQLPFFIIEALFQPNRIEFPPGAQEFSLVQLSYKFFKELMHLEGTETNFKNIKSSEVAHFVDFLRSLYIPVDSDAKGKLKTLATSTVTELHLAGVKFRVASSKNMFDMSFSNGVLEIPKLVISDETELTIRNLLAFEQCQFEKNNYLNDYAVMIDRLVNTAKDVELLVHYGVVENRLGDSSEAATLINKLADGVTMDYDNFYFAAISEQLDVYCKTSWHKWKANLKQRYFNTPWAIVSVIAAVLLIVLTIIQTICSVISVSAKS